MTATGTLTTLRFEAPLRSPLAVRTVPLRPTVQAQAQPQPRARTSRTRLTRRGRLAVLVVLVGLLLAAFTLGRADSQAATGSDGTRAPYATTTVHSGETLWTVARRVAPASDPRAVVQQIRELNDLESAA